MKNITKTVIDEKELAAVLLEWFNAVDFNKDHVQTRNPVLAVLKNELKKRGHWRNKRPKGFKGNFESYSAFASNIHPLIEAKQANKK